MAQARAKPATQANAERLSRPRVRILYRAELADFRGWLDRQRARPVAAGRGGNWFIDADDGAWVLRHYRRGGFVARLVADRYLWTGYARSRSLREFRLLTELRAAALPVPRPLAARVVRRGLVYRADLITEVLPGTVTLAARLALHAIDPAELGAVGRCVRAMHDMGVWHADLNAHNILLDDSGRVFLIDFDRARRRAGGHWKAGNLARLRRSLDKLAGPGQGFDPARWQTLLDGYRA